MAYTPPAWNQVALEFRSGYTPPAWNQVALEFRPAPPSGTQQGQSASGAAEVITPWTGATSQGQTTSGAASIFTRRPVKFAQAGLPWRLGARTDRQIWFRWRDGSSADHEPRIAWDPADPHDATISLAWASTASQDAQTRLPMSPGAPAARDWTLPWARLQPSDHQRRLPWSRARYPHAVQRSLPWVRRKSNDHQRTASWQRATPADHEVWLATGRAQARGPQTRLPWGMGEPPPFQYLPEPPYIPPPGPPPPPPCYVPPDWFRVPLRFQRANTYVPPAWDQVPLPFACDRRIFRIARSLRLSHSLSVVRLPDRLPLKVTAVSITSDRDSWAWSFSLRFADRASLLACAPSPEGVTSIEITLDGYVWTALVESYTESRELAKKQAAASGRSRTALLAAPYDPERAYQNPAPATAQQLALRELDFSGFALDWQLVDWTVPTGAWSYDRETHIGAILRVAAAAGGIVQAATDTDTLIVIPRHPYAPWEVASADVDVTIEAGSCINLGKRYVAGPGYQGVYVSGRDQGVRVHVYRDATSGSPHAELIVDPLISSTTPAVPRGKSALTAGTTREEISLLLPLTQSPAPPGLLTPGKLLEVEDATWGTYRALVTGVSVDAEVSGDGVLTARQNISIERYITA